MRKNAGFMMLTLLLLIVPALANAWTLTVKVAGGNANNSVAVTYPTSTSTAATATKTIKGGTAYLYPTKAGVTAVIAAGTPAPVITLDGAAYVPATLAGLTSGNHVLQVVYPADGVAGLSIDQNLVGGAIYAQGRNNTWSTTGVSGLPASTIVPITIAADGNHKILSYNVSGTVVDVANGTAGQVLSVPGVVAAGQTVTATFGDAAKMSASLFAPTDANTGNEVTCTLSPTSNISGLTYSYAVVGGAATVPAGQTGLTFKFTPTAVANYTVTATVTAPAGAANGLVSTVQASAVVKVSNAQVVANQSCNSCHSAQPKMAQHDLTIAIDCTTCHTPTPHSPGASCVGCHSVDQNSTEVANAGVRAVTGEFSKWSHHVTGVALNDAHCAACHLEGKVDAKGKISVDTAKHLVGDIINLRNADTDADMQWDPAAANHSTMDNFCMSCHDANGATSAMSLQIQAFINNNGLAAAGKTASPSNPFGDTISNRYDKMQRPAVVDAKSQFATGNASHHAVLGPKYSGRTRVAGSRQILDPEAFDNNSSATLWGKRSTIYDNINAKTGAPMPFEAFNHLYVPLEDAGGEAAPRTGDAELGDDSTLHCGDCHTVGQFKPNATVNAKGVAVATVIGAHGSNNEYLLRNTTGTDERHSQVAYSKNAAGNYIYANANTAALVCYNCHTFERYGSLGHAGESISHCNAQANTLTFKGYTTGTATDGTQFASRMEGPKSTVDAFAPGFPLNEANRPAFGELAFDNGGNAFGITCANCHNSGLDGGYGGIHGSTVSTYVDGMGNINTKRGFLPGLGNVKYVPGTLGGFTGGTTVNNGINDYITGGTSRDTNWEQVSHTQNGTTQVGASCYTLFPDGEGYPGSDLLGVTADGGATIPKAFGTWGACEDHGKVPGAGDHGGTKLITRPVTY